MPLTGCSRRQYQMKQTLAITNSVYTAGKKQQLRSEEYCRDSIGAVFTGPDKETQGTHNQFECRKVNRRNKFLEIELRVFRASRVES
ncbi:hypothetical protein JTE90_022291 [Oedothorax gibbosus]|uniref:Uncharacterized protein n=1 Tax=Oedothorax gibbosus TaxID=931172 RepID=A0AAV6VY50_9ARAC|nr:hypothetical protein JTE90_022291 [Oedothorax gibbosus]